MNDRELEWWRNGDTERRNGRDWVATRRRIRYLTRSMYEDKRSLEAERPRNEKTGRWRDSNTDRWRKRMTERPRVWEIESRNLCICRHKICLRQANCENAILCKKKPAFKKLLHCHHQQYDFIGNFKNRIPGSQSFPITYVLTTWARSSMLCNYNNIY